MGLIRNILTAAAVCVASLGLAKAQENEALTFVRAERNPVAAGMGFAGVAGVSETAYSSFRNASVIPFAAERMSFGVSGQNWSPDGVKSTNINVGGAVRTGNRFGFCIGGAYQTGEEYSSTTETGETGGTFRPKELILNGGAGFRILDNLAVGANVRYASQRLSGDDSYSAVAGDIFLTYRLSELSLTAGVSSLGASVKSESGDSFSLPASATVGADWSRTFLDRHGVRVAADADYFFSGNFTVAAGVQYSFKEMVFVRGGYHFGTKEAVLPSFATVGLGVRLFGVSLDAAYLVGNDALGGTMTIGIGYRF